MSAALTEFQSNLAICKGMTMLYQTVAASLGAETAADVSRAQVAFCVSALDRYVHERVRTGMLEIFSGTRQVTPHFERFSASLSVVQTALTSAGSNVWLDSHIRAANSLKSFQKSDKIADAVRIVSQTPLWPTISGRLGDPQADITTRIDLIADWRNRIVHEFDADPNLPGTRFAIARSDVQSTINFLAKVVKAIDLVVA